MNVLKTSAWMSPTPGTTSCCTGHADEAVSEQVFPSCDAEGPSLRDIMVWTSCKTQLLVPVPPRWLLIASLPWEEADEVLLCALIGEGWIPASECPPWARPPVNHQEQLLSGFFFYEVIQLAWIQVLLSLQNLTGVGVESRDALFQRGCSNL